MSSYGGSFTLGNIGIGRGGAIQKKKKKKPRPPGLSPEAWARREVEKLIAAQVAQIESQRKLYLDQLQKDSQLEMERGQALAQALQSMNMPGKIQGIFSGAGSDIAGLAKGFQGQIGQIANAQAAEQSNMLSGTGQEGAVRNEGEAMGNVAYGVGGFFPARSLTESGAAFGAQAALEPSFAQRIGQLEAANVHREGMKGMDVFTQALVEARSQKPSLIQEMLSERQEMVSEEKDAQRDWYLKLAALEMSRGNSKRANQYLRLAQGKEQRYANKDKGLDPDGNILPGFHEGPNGRIIKDGWHVGKNGKLVKDSTKKKSGADLPDWGDIQKDMASDADDFTEEVEVQDPEGLPGDMLTETRKLSYEEAYKALFTKYSGLVKNKARLRQLINRILRQKGFKKPGRNSGNPTQRSPDESIIPGVGR